MIESARKAEFSNILQSHQSKLNKTRSGHMAGMATRSRGEFLGSGIESVEVREEVVEPRLVYDPAHPDAREDGYVVFPDINVITEMVDMIAASRAYEANVTAMGATKDMLQRALEI